MELSPSSEADCSQPVKEFPAFYVTPRFITTFTKTHHKPEEIVKVS
jgi:hypothetical protein